MPMERMLIISVLAAFDTIDFCNASGRLLFTDFLAFYLGILALWQVNSETL
jgi:hypothetical protein